ncbi:Serine transporter [Corynebacterium pseudotuberculosis]|nr:Serine transporter [Corynebacterium pseudotuberculosis 1/06-A]AKS12709.1 Serine transporter [Corynebacterium pseudotuberculosis]APQ53496.1 Serine transporter [Corynebacterium pseudotuberculosis]APQ55555.1 Serine transporter [Corynebacterium pseudotuberculosis]ATB61286.1 Serine transporter [Corynebacterium pseudotuberculosis]
MEFARIFGEPMSQTISVSANSGSADSSSSDSSPSHSTSAPKWRKSDTVWALSLFGTAIGAGVLFLPINAGIGGIIPLIVMTIVAFPMTYWAHRGLTRFVLSSSREGGDLTDAVEEHFGRKAGAFMTILYFLSVYPILLVYSVTITNTVNSFLEHQLGVTPWPRWLMSLILVGGLIFVVSLGRDVIVKAMSVLVFPFIGILVLLSLYLVPKWNTSLFETFSLESASAATGHSIWVTLLLLVPVMVFSFNHSPIISSFAVEKREEYGIYADEKTGKVLKVAQILMVCVVMFFVFSCALSLSPQNLAEAKSQNITILSYLANHFDNPVIQWAAPVIAMIAVAKSFLGHYLGAAEGFQGLISKKGAEAPAGAKGDRKLALITLSFMLVTAWLVGWLNPSILGMIETLCGPTIAILLFLMPMYAIHKVPALQKYRGRLSNYFIFFMGLVAFGTIFYNIVQAI